MTGDVTIRGDMPARGVDPDRGGAQDGARPDARGGTQTGQHGAGRDPYAAPPPESARAFAQAMTKARGTAPEDLAEEAQGTQGVAPTDPASPAGPRGAALRGAADAVAQAVRQAEAGPPAPFMGKTAEVQVPIPVDNMLGLDSARLIVTDGTLSVMLRVLPAADAALVAAAIQDLAAIMAQRFPGRTIRVAREDEAERPGDHPAEQRFDPLLHPVGRRTT